MVTAGRVLVTSGHSGEQLVNNWGRAGGLACGPRVAPGMSSGSAPVAMRTFDLQGGDAHQVVGEHGGADQQLETLDALGQAALHAAPAEQHGDAALDAGPEALPLLEVGRLFTGFAFRSSLAAGLWDAHQLDAAVLAQRQVPFAEEAAARSVQLGNAADRSLVALQ